MELILAPDAAAGLVFFGAQHDRLCAHFIHIRQLLGIVFKINRPEENTLDALGHHHRAVSADEGRPQRSQGGGNGIPFFLGIHMPAVVINRNAGMKNSAMVHHRNVFDAGGAQCRCHRRMGMGHGQNVRPVPVDGGVDVLFRRQLILFP